MSGQGKVAGAERMKFDQQKELLKAILKKRDIVLCEYLPKESKLYIYDDAFTVKQEIPNYLDYLQKGTRIYPDDRKKAKDFFLGKTRGEIEIRFMDGENLAYLSLQAIPIPGGDPALRLPVIVQDVTAEKRRHDLLEEQAKKDSMTMLYNQFFGRKLINEYLKQKDPYSSCGMMIIDLDYFKYANDTYGHLFGDQVLMEIARLLEEMFDKKDVIMRAGGDEFVVFMKGIGHADLMNKTVKLIRAVREIKFEGKDFFITCSVGVCFLPENSSGYTYDQLFENADWALYRAKEHGRNCYVFCDNLQRFELLKKERSPKEIDIRYLHNDIISTAFEIFEKMSSFSAALELLMEVIGYRFRLDRITVIRTDLKDKTSGRQYQWVSENAPAVLEKPGSFTKEDFLTLFQSYDEYQTTVLHYDNMGMYSPEGAALLMQGKAKTVLYAAMYCEGQYTGAISYVVCREKRYWSRQNRKELGEVTKIISAHLARSQARGQNKMVWIEYDSLTGLISFPRFHMEAEQRIVGNYAASHFMLYSDIIGFKYFNQKYGYSMGDKLLKEFTFFFIDKLGGGKDILFARVIADQFLLLVPNERQGDFADWLDGLNHEFARIQTEKFQGARIQVRTGIYEIEPNCLGASAAMNAANYARKQVTGGERTVRVFDEQLKKKRRLENEIANGLDEAVREQRFQIYLQPRVSLKDGQVVGAEALARWETKDGTAVEPDDFIPLCESNGAIEELDFYVFERVAEFLAKNQKAGRKQVPISINASILHAVSPEAVKKYLDILGKYQVNPEYLEIELTETAAVKEYENAKSWFQSLRKAGIHTIIDDFGSGHSILNALLDIPVDTVKLDRKLVSCCTSSGQRGISFLKRLVQMIQELGWHVICEGVETKEQLEILKRVGCEEVQGFLFSKPMPLEEFEKHMYGKNEG